MKDEELNIDFSCNPSFAYANIRYDINSIINKLIFDAKTRDKTSIKNIITTQHELIFKYDNLVNNNRELVQTLFTYDMIGPYFLDTLEDVIGLLTLSDEEIRFINKIVYDFFEFSKAVHYSNEKEIKEKMLSITYTINAPLIRQLSNFIGINKANILAIISYSSFVDEKVVHRVNDFVIQNIRINDINELTFMYDIIFKIIPSYNDDLSLSRKGHNFILYSMLEYWDEEINDEESKDQHTMFINISMVIINILTWKDLNYASLITLLKEYGNMIRLLGISSKKVRFSLKKFTQTNYNDLEHADSLRRINAIIHEFNDFDSGIFIP